MGLPVRVTPGGLFLQRGGDAGMPAREFLQDVADGAPMPARFSRNGRSDPLGKRTEEVRAKTTGEVKDALLRAAREIGMTESEWLHEHLTVHFLGLDEALKLHRERLLRVSAMTDGKERERGEDE